MGESMRGFVRFVAAVVAGVVVGELVMVPVAVLIDVVAGAEVTGGRWSVDYGFSVSVELEFGSMHARNADSLKLLGMNITFASAMRT